MQDLEGRTALVTGAAGGIGLAIARALAAAGMRLALIDIEDGALASAAQALRADGAQVFAATADVADFEALNAAAGAAEEALGPIRVLCNNAGVGLEGPVESWTTAGWAWVLGVNVMGVVNGVRAVLPRIEAAGEGGHILNVSSIGGVTAAAHHGQYAASKFAVVGLSQSLRDELAPRGVGVGVLCPGFVTSRIATSARNAPPPLAARQAALMQGGFTGAAAELFATIERRTRCGLDPSVVGALALDAIRTNAAYVFTESEFFGDVERRLKAVRRAMDATLAREAHAPEREAARG